jgi:uncharacterized protein YndB with AHSA1/START domain
MTTQTASARMSSAHAMTDRESSSFEYVVYLCSTAEKVWSALTLNELRKHWWRGHTVETDWKPGSAIIGRFPDGSLEFKGRVVESERPRALAFEVDEIYWSDEYAGERPNRVSFAIETFGPLVKLTLRNEATPRLLKLVSGGWPAIMSSLKSLLETGTPLPLDEVFGPERNPGLAKGLAENQTTG